MGSVWGQSPDGGGHRGDKVPTGEVSVGTKSRQTPPRGDKVPTEGLPWGQSPDGGPPVGTKSRRRTPRGDKVPTEGCLVGILSRQRGLPWGLCPDRGSTFPNKTHTNICSCCFCLQLNTNKTCVVLCSFAKNRLENIKKTNKQTQQTQKHTKKQDNTNKHVLFYIHTYVF